MYALNLVDEFHGLRYYLLQKYDMYPDKEEEAKGEIISSIREFCQTYKGKDSRNDGIRLVKRENNIGTVLDYCFSCTGYFRWRGIWNT